MQSLAEGYVEMINAETPLFCPRKSCYHYQSGDNRIIKDGTYRTKNDPVPRQMFICEKGGHRFSETGWSGIFHKHGSFKEYGQVMKLTRYGLHTEAIADVLEKDIRTIAAWQKRIGDKCKLFHFFACLIMSICISDLQMDELWSYLGRKKRQLWLFIALDPKTKFWIHFVLGSRTRHSANRLISGIKKLVVFPTNGVLRITTDKLAAYKNAIADLLSDVDHVYLQIVKQRYRKILRTVKKVFVKGTEEDFPDGTRNTSFIERFNLTLRQRVSYLTRKTLGYCKNKANFECMLWMNLFDYNYCQIHKGLRVDLKGEKQCGFRRRYAHSTPAMKMNMADYPLDLRYLLTVPIHSKYLN